MQAPASSREPRCLTHQVLKIARLGLAMIRLQGSDVESRLSIARLTTI